MFSIICAPLDSHLEHKMIYEINKKEIKSFPNHMGSSSTT
jgi:hypothetical protein